MSAANAFKVSSCYYFKACCRHFNGSNLAMLRSDPKLVPGRYGARVLESTQLVRVILACVLQHINSFRENI